MVSAASERLLSEQWYRVGHLQPRLSPRAQVTCHFSRGKYWHVIGFAGRSERVRLNEQAYAVIGRCNGSVTLDQVFRVLLGREADNMPSQGEVIRLVTQLVDAGFMQCNDWPHIDDLLDSQSNRQKRRRAQYLNPMAPRIVLGNPNALLSHLDPLARFLFSGTGLLLWLVVLTLGVGTLLGSQTAITQYAQHWSQSPSLWLLSGLCYPLIKFVHELAHALAVRRWGGTVNETGIGFLLLFPAPYVDASHANQFAGRAQRAWVSAAGIAAELATAALAIITWSHLEPGPARDIAFSAATIALLSTVLFNANPLVRLDGYYVLTDTIDFPGLAQQSRQFWQSVLSQSILRITLPRPDTNGSNRIWLLAYQPLALAYRVTVLFWFSWWIASYEPVVGWSIGALSIGALLLGPLVRFVRLPLQLGSRLADAGNAWCRLSLAGLLVCLLALVPLPDRSLALATVSASDTTLIRARHDGFLSELLVMDGAVVRAGQPVARLTDPQLDAQIRALRQQLPGLQAAWLAALNTETAQSRRTMEKIRQANQQMAFFIDSRERLDAISPAQGSVDLAAPWPDRHNTFVRKGDVIGYLKQDGTAQVRAILTQHQATRLQQAANNQRPVTVSVRLHHGSPQLLTSPRVHWAPTPVSALPDAALAARHGGTIATDSRQAGSLVPLAPGYQLDIPVPAAPYAAIGSRAWVRIDFGYQLAVTQFARWLRQLVNHETLT